jgi:hypothetical protein
VHLRIAKETLLFARQALLWASFRAPSSTASPKLVRDHSCALYSMFLRAFAPLASKSAAAGFLVRRPMIPSRTSGALH